VNEKHSLSAATSSPKMSDDMADWLHELPVIWMTVVIFAGTYAMAAAIYGIVVGLAAGERGRAFKAVSPGMLPPLGIMFGLFVAFVAAQVWGDSDRAMAAVTREASALRAVVLLAASFPGEQERELRALVRRHIDEAVTHEWPAMGRHQVTLTMAPPALVEALRLALALKPASEGQVIAQRELVASLEAALEAQRQRIIISQSGVNWVKWTGLLVQAACTLIAIAMVHCENRRATAIALWIFATGVGICLVLIAAHTRPFTGDISVRPDALRQVIPLEPSH
jgi:hypothetical protein